MYNRLEWTSCACACQMEMVLGRFRPSSLSSNDTQLRFYPRAMMTTTMTGRGTSDVLGVNETVSYLPAIPLPLFQRVLQKFPMLPRDLREGRSRNDRFYPQIRWPRARLRPCISLPIRRLGELGVSLRLPRVEVVDKCRCSLPLLRGQQGRANAG